MTLLINIGFKPTGSTTAALVDLTNKMSVMLKENKYMHGLLIDFTMAFDSVDHLTLIGKLQNLNIADRIIQWVVTFLTAISLLSSSESIIKCPKCGH